uniref:Uncharacterized protein n=1 Tax=Hemiselmis andersenii TaxID=464988 RepID=A0A6U4V1K2_HEMAN|mmetsp:Transcript_25844/g.62707  ORF Transcript_25844/g.62707 Transcript_25844/m.62707 type:complete len:326 (+) Transcript_25844:80-1057(+)
METAFTYAESSEARRQLQDERERGRAHAKRDSADGDERGDAASAHNQQRTMENFFEEPDAEDVESNTCCESPASSDPSPRGSLANEPQNLAMLLAKRYGFCTSPLGTVDKRTRSTSPAHQRRSFSPSSSRSPSPVRQRCSLVGQDLNTNMTSHGLARQCVLGCTALVVLASAGTLKPKLSRSVEISYSHSEYESLMRDSATRGVPIPDKRTSQHVYASESDQDLCPPLPSAPRGEMGSFYEALLRPDSKEGGETCIRLRGGKQAASEAEHDRHSYESLALRGGVTCQDCANAQVKRQASDGSMHILGGKTGSAGFRPKLSRTVDL